MSAFLFSLLTLLQQLVFGVEGSEAGVQGSHMGLFLCEQIDEDVPVITKVVSFSNEVFYILTN